jgi:hypothetical protein
VQTTPQTNPPPPQLNRYPTQGQVSITMPMIKCMQTCKQDGNEQSFGDKNAGKQPREEKILRYHQINELETSQL